MENALNNEFYLWLFFVISISVALAVDMGLFTKTRQLFNKASRREVKAKTGSSNIETESSHLFKDNTKEIQSIEEPKQFKRALVWTVVWISLAAVFAVIILFTMGYERTLLFVTGYAIEKSLSVDNMFVFLLIFSSLAIPYPYQHKVLMIGILSAIAMRIALIIAGVSLLETFHFMIYVFGGLLLFTGIRMLIQKKEKKVEIEKNIAVRILKRFIPVTSKLNEEKFVVNLNGVIHATPLLVALVIVEMTDLVFALDSIPAILAITTDSFIVITSNIFAILGLRSLFFLLSGAMEKFHYLKPGLAIILLFVGIKMVASEYVKIPIIASLGIIFGVLSIAIMLSFAKTRKVQDNNKR